MKNKSVGLFFLTATDQMPDSDISSPAVNFKLWIFRGKKLADDATATMIRGTAIRPHERRQKIIDGLQKNNNIYKNDPYALEFGINFQSQMAKINGRWLFI